MNPRHYILNKQGEPEPVAGDDVITWAKWFEHGDRSVADETLGDSRISTVFLGLDHNYGSGPPVLWETMVFGGQLDQDQLRCSGGRAEAKAMHDRMVRHVITAKQIKEGG